jgi:TetR/AcrR family transcriptional regulator, lmrAB and yxaGH operons repressor
MAAGPATDESPRPVRAGALKVRARAELVPRLAEVFRVHGYEGASLAQFTRATGLGKGSLYHFFPGGKVEMAQAVLGDIDAWFSTNVFVPLKTAAEPAKAIRSMLAAVVAYFRSGRRVCLVGVLALGDARDLFRVAVRRYFRRWVQALAAALRRGGHSAAKADAMAADAIAFIQGALVLARASNQPRSFTAQVRRLEATLVGSLHDLTSGRVGASR